MTAALQESLWYHTYLQRPWDSVLDTVDPGILVFPCCPASDTCRSTSDTGILEAPQVLTSGGAGGTEAFQGFRGLGGRGSMEQSARGATCVPGDGGCVTEAWRSLGSSASGRVSLLLFAQKAVLKRRMFVLSSVAYWICLLDQISKYF